MPRRGHLAQREGIVPVCVAFLLEASTAKTDEDVGRVRARPFAVLLLKRLDRF